MKFRKKPVEIEAWIWEGNGSLPDDNSIPISPDNLLLSEGEIVRYYRRPDDTGERECKHCEIKMHYHGWIDTLESGHVVCPGDWIIRGVAGEFYPCKPDIFEATYDALAPPTREGDER